MKKLLLCLVAFTSFSAYSQISMQVSKQGNVIAPNGTVYTVTSPSVTAVVILDIKNTSMATKSYIIKRYDMLIYADGTSTAEASFCFAGSCYGTGIKVSPNALTLTAGQSASEVSGSFNMLTTDLAEANTVGVSIVKYTFANASSISDSLQITVAYNQPTGISEINTVISSFELSPNPVNETATIKINSAKAIDGKFCIFNALGAMVNERAVSLAEGKNKIDFSAEALPSGIYFANLKFGAVSTTKKFIVK